MIDINSLPTPKVVQNLDYETTLAENLKYFRAIFPDWKPLESDEFLIIAQAMAYREVALRNEFNSRALAFFLATAKHSDLDNWGAAFDCTRLQGSKPYSNYLFSLSQERETDTVIKKGLVLIDDDSVLEARLIEDITIPKGELQATGRVELQAYIANSEIETNNITTTLPYVLSAKATSKFAFGSNVESDDDFRFRIFLSMSDKSTAGSKDTYKSYAYKADERIEDVKVQNGLKDFANYVSLFSGKNDVEILQGITTLISDFCTVNVYYYSENADELMQQRIEDSLNSESVRPLTDYVKVIEATQKVFEIEAVLNCEKNQEYGLIQEQALANLQTNLKKLKKIGTSITLSEINDFLRVGGVKEVVILNPTQNIEVLSNEIGVCSGFNISTATI